MPISMLWEDLMYIYTNNKLEHEKRTHSNTFYKKYLEDGDIDEKEEPYSSRKEDENKN